MIDYTEYKDFKEYEKYTNNTKDDFKEMLENYWIEDITCSTYNGASDTTDYWQQTEENIKLEIIQYMHDTDFYNEYDYDGILDNCTTEEDYAEVFCEINKVFLLDNHLYLDLD